MFHISTDQYIFLDKPANKTSLRRQVDTILDVFGDKELTALIAELCQSNLHNYLTAGACKCPSARIITKHMRNILYIAIVFPLALQSYKEMGISHE